MAQSVDAFDQLLAENFQKYLSLSKSIGGIVEEQAGLVNDAFQEQKKILLLAVKFNMPTGNEQLQLLTKPISDKMIDIQNHRSKHRTSEFFNHLSAVSESIAVLGWIVVTPDPSKYAKELHATAAYYGNKVITTYKHKNTLHSDWAKTWLEVLLGLHSYIRENHRTGLSWNIKGSPATVTSIVQGGGVPAPPPPPPPELFAAPTATADDPRAALFKSINQGADITKCLKSVDKTQEKQAGILHAKSPISAAVSVKKKPPRFALDGRKWCVEYQEKAELTISDVTMNQCVCIYQCNNSFITVNGKVNCITLDSCKKTSVVFKDVVSYVEFINCQSVKAQTLGKLPTITIDKTDGIQLFLSAESLDVEVISSKSSELNICVPKGDDYVELPVAEQLKTTITKTGLKTVAIEKA